MRHRSRRPEQIVPATPLRGDLSPSSTPSVSKTCSRPCASRRPRAHPVVVRGAGTGLAGAANAGAGEIVLSLRRMTAISEIRPDDLLAVVEPGILNADLNAELATHGLWWAPDPASRDISTVGGNIATGRRRSAVRQVRSGARRGARRRPRPRRRPAAAPRSPQRQRRDRPRSHRLDRRLGGHTGRRGRSHPQAAQTRARRDLHRHRDLPRSAQRCCSLRRCDGRGRAAGDHGADGCRQPRGRARPARPPGPVCGHGPADHPDRWPAAAEEADTIAAILRAHDGETVVSHERVEGERLLAIRRSMQRGDGLAGNDG